MYNIGIIVQARMGSNRLPGKVLINLKGKPVLEHIIDRLKLVKTKNEIIIATSIKEQDDVIEEFCTKRGIKIYRGSEENVLKRFYLAAKEYELDIIIRITGDCPLIDPNIIDQIVEYFLKEDYDMVTNGGYDTRNRTFPRGLDVSVFSFEVLEEALNNSNNKSEKEHVTPYIYKNKRVGYYKNDKDYSKYRLTLDTVEDLKLIENIYNNLYFENSNNMFYLKEIIDFLENNPKLINLNKDIVQKID